MKFMPSLRELQMNCHTAFTSGDAVAISAWIAAPGDSASLGVRVYQNNAQETFRLALAACYPVIEALVGTECFASLARRYSATHPSMNPDLQEFGDAFPYFLDNCFSQTSHRYLADVATLERATEQVLLEPEPRELDLERLAGISPSQLSKLSLVRSPAARLVTSEYPIFEIWRMHHRDQSRPVSLDDGPGYVSVVRNAGDAVLRPLSALEYELACQLTNELAIGDAIARLDYQSLPDVQAALAALLRSRLFVDINQS